MFFDRPDSGERALLVQMQVDKLNPDPDTEEFIELVRAAGAEPVALVGGRRAKPHARLFVGTGKLEEIRDAKAAEQAELIIFDHDLSPAQERNIERELQCRVLGRTGLILDIFAQRARTHEGKLQVELAQLQHLSTRLVRGWTHLERQKGGIGLRGPGETQLETDRRLLRERIKSIRRRLEKVRSQREQGRRSRKRAEIPVVSLVGYTNAGKSTLFNRLTDSEVYAQDQLFATLDPTMRRIELEGFGPVILADTVGFISQLPHGLVEAFRATLEEAASADLLLEVVDLSSPDWRAHAEEVSSVLEEIGAEQILRLRLFNKLDRLADRQPELLCDSDGKPASVALSAKTGEGLDLLTRAIADSLGADRVKAWYCLPADAARLLARLHDLGAVTQSRYLEDGRCQVELNIERADWHRLLAHEYLSEESLTPIQGI